MPASNPHVLSVATAVPPYRVPQSVAKDFARHMFSGVYRDVERLLPVFDHSGVEHRNFCVPPEWFYEAHTFAEKNALYVENALDLSAKAGRRALDKIGADPGDVGAVVFVSTTGISTPSIGSDLIFELGLPQSVRRVPVFGLGCAAGAAGLALAADLARVRPDELVLLVGVELCGLTFQEADNRKAGLISLALFGDGAAAVVVGAQGNGAADAAGPELLGGHSTTWRDTRDIMGWKMVDTGFEVILHKSIPDLIHKRVPENLRAALDSAGLAREELKHLVVHPGGAKVLDAFEDVLEVEPGSLVLPREVLREHGNMSSVTVLFILERLLESGECGPGEHGILTAMGPGFSAEHVFFRG
jgi:alkylresorcinol/alkylpyrone synthase